MKIVKHELNSLEQEIANNNQQIVFSFEINLNKNIAALILVKYRNLTPDPTI
jgi:hypothetical protein